MDAYVWTGVSIRNESESYKLSLEILMIFTGIHKRSAGGKRNYTDSEDFSADFSATVCTDKFSSIFIGEDDLPVQQ